MARTLTVAILFLPCVLAQVWSEEKKWSDPGSGEKTSFGGAVDIDGSTVIVGAIDDGTQAGAAYIYRVNSSNVWKTYKLKEALPTANHNFGKAVCIKGDLAVVTTYAGLDGGSAQIFAYSSTADAWNLEQHISGKDTAGSSAYFGGSCSTDGIRVVVGAHKDSGAANNAGAAYVFKKNSTGTWTQEAKLQGSDAQQIDYFAYPNQGVSIKGDVIICGARNAGKAYIFRLQSPAPPTPPPTPVPTPAPQLANATGNTTGNSTGNSTGGRRLTATDGTWTEEQILQTGVNKDYFGDKVAIDGDVAVIGSKGATVDGKSNSGKVWIFRKSSNGNWMSEANLTLPQTVYSDVISTMFGSSVAVEGNRVVAGASYYKASALGLRNCGSCDRSGAVQTYMYNGSAWAKEDIFYASNGKAYHSYGTAVAVSGKRIVVGSVHPNTKEGNAYVMEIPPPSPPPTPPATETSSGASTSNTSSSTGGSTVTGSTNNTSSNASSVTTTGELSVKMSSAHATALTSNLAKAKDIFAKAMATTLSGVTASQITIEKIFVDEVEVTSSGGRRLSTNSTNSSDATVRVEWSITSDAAVMATSLSSGTSLKEAIVAEAATQGVTIVIKGEITVAVTTGPATTTAAPSGAGTASGCIGWNVRTGLASVLLAFFTLASI